MISGFGYSLFSANNTIGLKVSTKLPQLAIGDDFGITPNGNKLQNPYNLAALGNNFSKMSYRLGLFGVGLSTLQLYSDTSLSNRIETTFFTILSIVSVINIYTFVGATIIQYVAIPAYQEHQKRIISEIENGNTLYPGGLMK